MVDQQERLWTFDAVDPGQIGNETTVEITSSNIAEYARLSVNHSPLYQSGSSNLAAMPTIVKQDFPLIFGTTCHHLQEVLSIHISKL